MDAVIRKQQENFCSRIAKKYFNILMLTGEYEFTRSAENALVNYKSYVKKTGIPQKLLSEIEEVVDKKRCEYRASDIYKYW